MNTSPLQQPGTNPEIEGEDPNIGLVVEVEEDDPTMEMDITDDVSDLAEFVKERWAWCRDGRKRIGIEDEWMLALLNDRGEYSDEVLSKIRENKSKVFVKLTRSVRGAARALIMQIYASELGRAWELRPTEIPEIEGIDLRLMQEAREMAAKALPPDQAQEFMDKTDFKAMLGAAKSEALDRMNGMRYEIEDQLQEMHYDDLFLRSLDPLTLYGTAVWQGPLAAPKKPRRWAKDKEGNWKLALSRCKKPDKKKVDAKEEGDEPIRPEFRLLDNWMVYPDPGAVCFDDMQEICIRHVMARHNFRGMAGKSGFKAEAIDESLNIYSENGNWTPEWWEAKVEGGDHSRKHDRFVVIEYYGYINGRKLSRYGVDVPEGSINDDCLVNIWVCGGTVLKCVVINSEPNVMPFFFVPYEQVPNRLWARGIPAMMDDSQDIYNTAERAKMDNMAISSSFQAMIDLSRLSDRTDPKTIYPEKTWFFTDMDGGSGAPINFFQPASNVAHMQAIQDAVRLHIQKETNLPESAMGIPGGGAHNRTAEGLSMQRDQALAFIRSVIGNIDVYGTQRQIESMYHWNMAFNENEDIKGDYDVVAKGVSGAISRELMTQKLSGLMNQMGNELKYWFKNDKTIQLWLRMMGFDEEGIVNTPEEVAAAKQAELQMQHNAETEAQNRKMQPVTPKENAVLQLLTKADERSPLYGPTFELALNTYGLMNPRFAAAINAVNEVAAANVSAVINDQDKTVMTQDITPQEIQAQVDLLKGATVAANRSTDEALQAEIQTRTNEMGGINAPTA